MQHAAAQNYTDEPFNPRMHKHRKHPHRDFQENKDKTSHPAWMTAGGHGSSRGLKSSCKKQSILALNMYSTRFPLFLLMTLETSSQTGRSPVVKFVNEELKKKKEKRKNFGFLSCSHLITTQTADQFKVRSPDPPQAGWRASQQTSQQPGRKPASQRDSQTVSLLANRGVHSTDKVNSALQSSRIPPAFPSPTLPPD